MPAADPAPPRAPQPSRPARAAVGHLTLVSSPFAYVTANGRDLGMTPIWRAPVRAGRVRVEAVATDGRRTSFTVTVAAGNEVRRRVDWDAP
ncbi:MAG TPA: hypothetical protein VFU21_25480 [Kofleriaceae bacterium]|nr:hypothetical protein [Kofleriaceae bacterium]